MTETKRLYWIDSAKAIGMLLVILGHMYSGSRFHWLIFSFHMPLFFAISGFLYKHVGIKKEISKILFSLFIPYLLYSVLLMTIYFAMHGVNTELVINHVIGNHNGNVGIWVPICPLWFIMALIWMRLIATILCNKILLFLGGAIILYMLLNSIMPETLDILKIKSTLLCFPFFVMGQMVNKYHVIEKFFSEKNVLYREIYLIVFLSLGVIWGYSNGSVDVNRNIYGNNLPTFYIVATSLIFVFLSLCKIYIDQKWAILQILSEGTFLTMALHYVMINPLLMFMPKFLAFITIVVICILLTCLSKKFVPILLGKNIFKSIKN